MPTPTGAPSIVDVIARQVLASADQTKAVRAALDAIDAQNNAVLETIRMLQDMETQRVAAATMRTQPETGPKVPPVFGKQPAAAPSAEDAPPLPPVPAHIPRANVEASGETTG